MSLIYQFHRLPAPKIRPATDHSNQKITSNREYPCAHSHRAVRLGLTKNRPSWTEFWQDDATTLILCREHIPKSREEQELSIDIANNMSLDIGQPEISTRVAIGEPLVVQPHQIQNCGVQIVNVNLVLGGVVSVIIR